MGRSQTERVLLSCGKVYFDSQFKDGAQQDGVSTRQERAAGAGGAGAGAVGPVLYSQEAERKEHCRLPRFSFLFGSGLQPRE